jgi:hypothetical protein
MKTSILAKDLGLIALQKIHALPGTEYVVSAHIERGGNKWALIASVKDGADISPIQDAVRRTERDLQRRYKLLKDNAPHNGGRIFGSDRRNPPVMTHHPLSLTHPRS